MSKIIPVILSGGSGTRLCPLSRAKYPKQFLNLITDNSMLQETIIRLKGLKILDDLIIVCNIDHRFLVLEQISEIDIKKPRIILEPFGKNTAPAIAAAAMSLNCPQDSILLVLSADHHIQDLEEFHKAINFATKHAEVGSLVTFGIVPKDPNIGFGYIKCSNELIENAYDVEKFIEKPNLDDAKHFLSTGSYLWNSGMFMFKANVFLDELNTYASSIVEFASKSVNNAKNDLDFICLDEEFFRACPSMSIDYALMEKAKNVKVVPLDAKWRDVGSFSTLNELTDKDEKGNVIFGDVYTEETTNSYIKSTSKMIATIGLNDLIIIDTPDVTLISSKSKIKDIKKIVNQLKNDKREEEFDNRKVYRPWGWFDVIETGRNFQVKRLNIKPGAKLSLQRHFKRAEHWVVVYGEAKVVNGNSKFTLSKGESTFIPIGAIHCLENITLDKLEIIEVQSGTYLGEDDIERFEDIYGRLK